MSGSNNADNQLLNSIAGFVIMAVVGYFAFTQLFPSDRATITRCISAMVEASRGEAMYGQLRQQLTRAKAAESIRITSRKTIPFGNDTIRTFEYESDGRPSSIMCSM